MPGGRLPARCRSPERARLRGGGARYAVLVRRFLSPRWLVRHLAVIVLVTAFALLAVWQVDRARSGNTLSIAYAAEWPLFALFVIAMWVREIRAELRPPDAGPVEAGADQAPRRRPVAVPVRVPVAGDTRPGPENDDPALTAYNDYLAWLAANPDRSPAHYRPNRQGE